MLTIKTKEDRKKPQVENYKYEKSQAPLGHIFKETIWWWNLMIQAKNQNQNKDLENLNGMINIKELMMSPKSILSSSK